jgi:hypothetical protein
VFNGWGKLFSAKAEISRLENNLGCLGKLVNSLDSNCCLKSLLMMPFLKGVLKIKIFQMFCFAQNVTLYLLFYPVFSLQNPVVPGCSTQVLPPFRL